jgi:phosphate transport system substrate-binding protein
MQPTQHPTINNTSTNQPTLPPELLTTPHKKIPKNLIILIAAIILTLLLCALAYFFFTKTWIFSESSSTPEPTQEEPISTDPIFAPDTYPKFDASTATQPLALAFYKNFTGIAEAKLTDFPLTKTHEAYVKLINGEVDLILVTSPSEDEQNLAAEKGLELEVTPVVNEGFVFFVSSENPIDSLTIDQIQKIYTGEITNWNQVGGPDLSIIAYQRPANSGSQTGMLDLVMQGKPMKSPETEDITLSSMAAIIDMVSSYKNAPSAIGYSYYYYVKTMYQDIDKATADGIKLLAIDDIKPDTDSIKSKSYPFSTSYYIVTRKNDTSEATTKLKDAMLSPRGQKVALEADYVPVK